MVYIKICCRLIEQDQVCSLCQSFSQVHPVAFAAAQASNALEDNVAGQTESGQQVSFALDEMETFEGCRSTRPLTVPFLIEQETTFLIDARCAPIPPSGKMTPERRLEIERRVRRLLETGSRVGAA